MKILGFTGFNPQVNQKNAVQPQHASQPTTVQPKFGLLANEQYNDVLDLMSPGASLSQLMQKQEKLAQDLRNENNPFGFLPPNEKSVKGLEKKLAENEKRILGVLGRDKEVSHNLASQVLTLLADENQTRYYKPSEKFFNQLKALATAKPEIAEPQVPGGGRFILPNDRALLNKLLQRGGAVSGDIPSVGPERFIVPVGVN